MKEHDYKCSKCDRRMTLEAERKPRWCHGKRMTRVIHASPVIWKTPGCTRTVPFPDKKEKK